MHEHKESRTFLLQLSDAVKTLVSPIDVERTAAQIAMGYFSADRCYFGEIHDGRVIVRQDAARGNLPSMAEIYSPGDASLFRSVWDAGQPFVVHDVSQSGIVGKELKDICLQSEMISFIKAPVIKNGQPAGIFCLAQRHPRKWTAGETELAAEAAEYILVAIEKAKLEEALRDSEERLYLAGEAAKIGTFIYYPGEDRLEPDAYMRQLYGLPAGRTLNLMQALAEVMHPDDRERYAEDVARSLAITGNGVLDSDIRIIHPDGSVRWMNIRARTVFENDRAISMSGVSMDITDRKADKAVCDSERRTREVLDALAAAVYTTDGEGRLTYYNRAAVALAGRTPELGSDSWCVSWKLYWPDGTPLPHDQCPMAIALKEDRPVFGLEAVLERPDGTRVPFAPYPVPLHDAAGKLIGGVNMLVDITWRKQAEEALRRSEENYRAMVNQAIAGILKVDMPGKIIFANDQMGKMLGYSVDELLQMPVADLIYEEDKTRHSEMFLRLKNEGLAYEIEKRLVCKNGSVIWVNNQVSPISDTDGKSAVIISVDITQQKAVEKQKDEFIGIASHELKTPLTSIQGYAQLLQKAKDEDVAEKKTLISRLNAQVERMTKLVYALLDTSRISSGQLMLKREMVDMNKLVEDCVEEMQLVAPHHQLIVRTAGVNKLYVDYDRIRQVIINLLSNAVKYSPAKSKVVISTERSNNKVKVSVKDSGIGITPSDQQNIFKRFGRVNAAANMSGLGLGLYISAEIVKLHSGRIGVESDPGKETVFCFELPYTPET